jgi:hypothetical protein
MSRPTARVLSLGVALVLPLALAACGGEEGTAPTGGDEPVVIEVTFADGTVDPKGDRVQVGVGQEVVFEITAEEAGELHAHTTEELELAYPAGESEQTMVVDQPGVVDVESHDLDQIVVQLQVS